MGLTKTVLKRPVTTVMVILCLIVFGITSVLGAKMELMPEMSMPMLFVVTTYAGASPEDVNDLVSTVIEDDIGALSGIDTVYSYSMENVSYVILSYDYDKDIDEAYDELKKKIDIISNDLPDDCDTPMVIQMNMDEMAVVTLSVNNPSRDDLYNYVVNELEPEFKKITSVSDIDVSGGQEEYISVTLLPEKLSQYHLTQSSLVSAIGSADFSYPAGDTDVGGQELSVSVGETFDTEELLKNLPISLGNGNIIYLSDVADIRSRSEDATGVARYDGNDTISLGIKKQQSAAAVDVSRDVKKVVKQLEAADPNLQITIVDDTSDNIKDSLSNVWETMVMAVVVAMIIIWLFFGEIKASLIVGTSIPISILAALILMQQMGFTLNVVTLGALVLGVGMMVDNSIVVLESCFRSTEGSGLVGYQDAAVEGSGKVLLSIVGSTLTTCVVFAPLAFLTGLTGMMFKPLGFTIIFCMTASLISAMTVVPLCYCYYKPKEKADSPAGGAVRAMQAWYRDVMELLLTKRALVILTTIGLFAFSIFLASQLRTELIAESDTGKVSVSIETRPGLTVEEADKIYAQVEEIVTSDEDVEHYMITAGGSGYGLSTGGATLTAYLKDSPSRKTAQVIKDWKPLMNAIAGANISMEIASDSSMSTTQGDGIEYVLNSTDYDKLKSVSDSVVDELLKDPQVSKVHSTLENAAPVVKVNVDPVKASADGISPLSIYSQVSGMLQGKEATTLTVDGNEISVMVEYDKTRYDSIDELQGIVLTTDTGSQVALKDVADIYFKDSPATIRRVDKQYQATISGDSIVQDKKKLTALQDRLYDEVVSKYVDDTVTRGQDTLTEMMGEEFANLGMAIAAAIFLVFVVMAAQFESPKYSLMVMTTIPFALIGSFALMFVTDCAISMTSLLGFLMLVGTVVNNGILYVDTVNQYRAEMDLHTALIEAGATRLRPILMTTLTTIVAMIPMAVGYGKSGARLQGLAMVDVGGLIASTILALLMLPVYYDVMTIRPKHVSNPD